MPAPAPAGAPVVRAARGADLRLLAGIQQAGGVLFETYFRAHLGIDHDVEALRAPAPTGAQRDAAPGFLLVAGAPVVGFVHVVEIDDEAHLEQVSVHPDHVRRGLGTALVRAAMHRARAAGHHRLSLCTYRDVPFNGPFYAALGFTQVHELLAYQRRLREAERSLGLNRAGVRVVMSAALAGRRPATDGPLPGLRAP